MIVSTDDPSPRNNPLGKLSNNHWLSLVNISPNGYIGDCPIPNLVQGIHS